MSSSSSASCSRASPFSPSELERRFKSLSPRGTAASASQMSPRGFRRRAVYLRADPEQAVASDVSLSPGSARRQVFLAGTNRNWPQTPAVSSPPRRRLLHVLPPLEREVSPAPSVSRASGAEEAGECATSIRSASTGSADWDTSVMADVVLLGRDGTYRDLVDVSKVSRVMLQGAMSAAAKLMGGVVLSKNDGSVTPDASDSNRESLELKPPGLHVTRVQYAEYLIEHPSVKHSAKHQGFDGKQLRAFALIFSEFDGDRSATISTLELRAMMRCLGRTVSPAVIYDLVRDIDVDRSGDIDFLEFLSLVGQFLAEEKAEMETIFEARDVSGDGMISASELRPMLFDIGIVPNRNKFQELFTKYDQDRSGELSRLEFFALVADLRKVAREEARNRGGFSVEEVEAFSDRFKHYDTDRSGELEPQEVMSVFADLGVLPKTKAQQDRLTDIMRDCDRDQNGVLSLTECLSLVRRFLDEAECDAYLCEARAVEEAGFSADEVNDFRDIFREEKRKNGEFRLGAMMNVVRRLGVALDPELTARLKAIYQEYAVPSQSIDSGMVLGFPEFIRMIGRLIRDDFGSVNQKSAMLVHARAEEEKRITELLANVKLRRSATTACPE